MKTITKEQVLARLVKYGNNEKDAAKLIEKNFAYAVDKYSTLKTICEVIVTLH
jgi:hypothetical protein